MRSFLQSNEYWLVNILNLMALTGALLAASRVRRMLQSLSSAGMPPIRRISTALAFVLFLPVGTLLSALPFLVGYGLYLLSQRLRFLGFLFPEPNESITTRLDAVVELLRYSPLMLVVILILGLFYTLAAAFGARFQAMQSELAQLSVEGRDSILASAGVGLTIAALSLRFLVDIA